MTTNSNAEIAKAAEGYRESHALLVDNQDFNRTFHVNSLRNDLWCVACIVAVERISSKSQTQHGCHSLENLCNCVIVPAVTAFFRRNSHRLAAFSIFGYQTKIPKKKTPSF